ncbi:MULTISPECIES: hypothetical protein [Mycobacteroides]|jgi:hypothetical protein|uniref:hypothetical protein n=1 Tax=Mycobacteroides TaxID=670516 RepID=UPI0009946834|nr:MULTISPECIES: hypothetical protein [Mycobacteroides]SKR76821.1 Uncharacterised protein [Mycobacteroides abscessus subsp. abscessus]SLC82423.1 Uncharacterised protein [Mycobacteroides abscessus subsp. massiliense]
MAEVNPGQWFNDIVDEDRKHRRDLRERALYSATLLHCETGDAMAIFDREGAANDVLATAQQFYDWITGDAE